MPETAIADAPSTVRDVLRASAPEMRRRLPEDEALDHLLGVAGAAADALSGVRLPGSTERILELLEELLAIPLPGVLASAWRRYEPFLAYADPAAHPPGSVHQVPLVEHSAEATWHPAVELLVEGTATVRIEFEAHVRLSLDGAVVTVREGRFRSVRAGAWEVEGSVRLGDLVLAERGRERIEMPSEVALGENGIAIVPGGADAGEPRPAAGGREDPPSSSG